MRISFPALTLGVLLAGLSLAACDSSPSAAEVEDPFEQDMALILTGTAAYQDVAVAVADGFVPLSECVASPAGGMGFHYGHPGRIEDPAIDPERPELLLYEPLADGGMRLVGVEFMVHRDAWHGAGNAGAPAVAGQSFDPPNPQHPDHHLREFYTLHVWSWVENPLGMFAPFNPQVGCG